MEVDKACRIMIVSTLCLMTLSITAVLCSNVVRGRVMFPDAREMMMFTSGGLLGLLGRTAGHRDIDLLAAKRQKEQEQKELS